MLTNNNNEANIKIASLEDSFEIETPIGIRIIPKNKIINGPVSFFMIIKI
jgi:hypothetical protein